MKTILRILLFFLLVSQICFSQYYWSKVGDMPEIRYGHTVNKINGKIYIVGGLNTELGVFPTTALVYDVDSNKWTQKIPLSNNEVRALHTSCVFDGKLYIIGGGTMNGDTAISTGEMDIFDPNTGQWTPKNPMPTHRANLTCALIDGKIYVMGGHQIIGGVNYLSGLKTVEVYNISSDTWTKLADMPTGRWGLRAISFNGKIYVFGGATADAIFDAVEVYDPKTNTWVISDI